MKHILTILAVQDMQQARAFYEAAFDWTVKVDVPVYVEYEMPDGKHIGLYERDSFGENTGAVPRAVADGELTGTELYFHSDHLEADLERVRNAGGRLLSDLAPRDWGDEAAYFADPDGNLIVVARSLVPRG